MAFQSFDSSTNVKIPRHKRPSSTDDEFETPDELYQDLCYKYNIFPQLDVAATKENSKCKFFFTKEDNALNHEWYMDFWCNHPHTLHAEFVEKCHKQVCKNDRQGLQIIPANCARTTYWHKYIEGKQEYHAIKGSITFFKDGKPTKDSSRNAYFVIVWRKRIV